MSVNTSPFQLWLCFPFASPQLLLLWGPQICQCIQASSHRSTRSTRSTRSREPSFGKSRGNFLDEKSSRNLFWVGNIHEHISEKIGNIHFSEFERSFVELLLCYMDLKGGWAFHESCGSPQWWWLHKSRNTCRWSDLWETSKSYLLNCHESRLCLWPMSRQRVQFPDPLVMRYDIRLSYHRDFTLFPKTLLVLMVELFSKYPTIFWLTSLAGASPSKWA